MSKLVIWGSSWGSGVPISSINKVVRGLSCLMIPDGEARAYYCLFIIISSSSNSSSSSSSSTNTITMIAITIIMTITIIIIIVMICIPTWRRERPNQPPTRDTRLLANYVGFPCPLRNKASHYTLQALRCVVSTLTNPKHDMMPALHVVVSALKYASAIFCKVCKQHSRRHATICVCHVEV